LVTHNPVEAAFIADRIVVMSKRPGRIVGEVVVPILEERTSALFATEELNQFVREARMLLEFEDDAR
jgi:NitT/TauT family transport system ATP-binding protein